MASAIQVGAASGASAMRGGPSAAGAFRGATEVGELVLGMMRKG